METVFNLLTDADGVFFRLFGDLTRRNVDLSVLEMSLRAGLVFLITLGMVRLAGRRAIGLRTPVDTVVSLLLGALLSRAVVGASSFVGVVAACLVLVTGHRLLTWANLRSPALNRFINGEKRALYADGQLQTTNMRAALLSKTDLQSEVRQKTNAETFEDIQAAYMEPNGAVSVIKKQSELMKSEPIT